MADETATPARIPAAALHKDGMVPYDTWQRAQAAAFVKATPTVLSLLPEAEGYRQRRTTPYDEYASSDRVTRKTGRPSVLFLFCWISVGFLLALASREVILNVLGKGRLGNDDLRLLSALTSTHSATNTILDPGQGAGAGQVLLRMRGLLGAEVVSTDGHKLGRVDEVMFDPKSQQLKFAIIKAGTGSLGLGTQRVIVPIDQLVTSRSGHGWVLAPQAE